MTSYRSVVRLYQAIKNSNPSSVLSLRRLGTHRFLLESTAVSLLPANPSLRLDDSEQAPLEFVFGQGFKPKSALNEPVAQFAGFKNTFAATGHLLASRKFHRHRNVIVFSGLVLALAAAVPVALHAIDAVPVPDIAVSKTVASNASSHTKTTVGSSKTCPSTLEQAEQAVLQPLDKSIMADEIIGGVRQLTFTDVCTDELMQVRLYKLKNVWKAKSATPLGSHSLN